MSKSPKHFDLKSQIIHCLVSHAFFLSISSFILRFSYLLTGILEHGSVYLISIQAILNFYDKNNKSLIKHVYL